MQYVCPRCMSDGIRFIFDNYYKEIYFVIELINKKIKRTSDAEFTRLDITKKKEN